MKKFDNTLNVKPYMVVIICNVTIFLEKGEKIKCPRRVECYNEGKKLLIY